MIERIGVIALYSRLYNDHCVNACTNHQMWKQRTSY